VGGFPPKPPPYKKGRKAIITSLEKADEAIAGKTGTVIVNE